MQDSPTAMSLARLRPAEAFFSGYIEGRYLPTWTFFVSALLFVASNSELARVAREAWEDYVAFLNTLESRNGALYSKWVETVARNMRSQALEAPSGEFLGFLLGRVHRSALARDATYTSVFFAGLRSGLALTVLVFPQNYLRAVIVASRELRRELAKSTADRALLASAGRLAHDMLPLAVRLANTTVASFGAAIEGFDDDQDV